MTTNSEKFYAHSVKGAPVEQWQPLQVHLENVAELCEKFAGVFGATKWGYCAGILHDAGKATVKFQKRLEGCNIRVDHSSFGARTAKKQCGRLGLLLSYIIAGHHGGLPDGGRQQGQLHYRLDHAPIPDEARLLPGLSCGDELYLPFILNRDRAAFSLSLFTRMIFSCLVDADFLDTEQFCSPHRARYRSDQSSKFQLADLREIFDRHMQKVISGAVPSRVNGLRREIFRQCVSQSSMPQGIFSLTVPTGGGKTLSSMAFALNHAVKHGLRRIIYAIPFTSIIEQNARVFKEIFGPEVILEHHSNLIEDDPDEHDLHPRHRLAAENWDLPVVVTTNVQFFESLFASKTSRCRKLHNIAGSVIILDEAQAIPTEYLKPCLAALHELVSRYKCSVVLCTATQPALDDTSSLRRNSLPDIREIIEDTGRYFHEFQRVEIKFIGRKTDAELASLLARKKQVLCIVSTKPQARSVFELLDDEQGTFHLSTNLYPLHRQQVLQEIRKRLRQGQACRVVSTSLVEAGVDLDFPVVFRAMAGLDSIAQAAGRCNREGKLNADGRLGKVFVFESEKTPSMPWLKRCISRARETLRAMPDKDPLGREMMRRYFELLYDVQELDGKKIMKLLNSTPLNKELCFPFREAAQLFKFIEEDTVELIIAREPECDELVRVLRHGEYSRTTLRKLQPFTVSVRKEDMETMLKAGGVEMIETDNQEVPVLCNKNSYDQQLGLCVDRAGVWDADDLIT